MELYGKVMPFGKHKGVDIALIPDGYLKWLYEERIISSVRSPALAMAIDFEYEWRFSDEYREWKR